MGYRTGYLGGYAADDIASAPELLVEWSTAQPADTPVWVDVTADVMAWSSKRGRNRELDKFQAGTLTVTFLNLTAKYDPNNDTSPLAGHVKPMRRLRVTASYAGVSYPVFDGHIDSIDQQYSGPNYAAAVVQATDAFKVLAAAQLPVSPWVAEVLEDEPVAWYRLDDPEGTIAVDSVADQDATVFGAVTFQEPSLVARDPGNAISVANDGDYVSIPATVAPSGTGVFTVEFLIRTLTTPTFGARLLASPGSSDFEIGLGPTVFSQVPLYFIAGGATVDTGTFGIADGLVHHLVFRRAATGHLRIYVDGVNRTSVATIGAGNIAAQPLDFGNHVVGLEDQWAGDLDELVIYNTELSDQRIGEHAETISIPWREDLPGQRILRVTDMIGWPQTRVDQDNGDTLLQSATLGMSALEHLQKVADSEFGVLFIAKNGDIRFISRDNLRNQTSAGTFSDDPVTAGHVPYRSQQPEYSDRLIRNDVTVSRLEGVAQNWQDTASIAEYLHHSYTLDGLYHLDDDHSRALAQYLVSEYAEPVRRISRLQVSPHADPAVAFPVILGVELTNVVTVIERPPDVTNTQVSTVEMISHQWRGGIWETTFNVTPAAGGTGTFWQVGVPGRSELGVTTRLGV